MLIQEAIKARTNENIWITREAWMIWRDSEPLKEPPDYTGRAVLPTDGPSGCIYFDEFEKAPRPGWKPTAEDLTADDWWPTTYCPGTWRMK